MVDEKAIIKHLTTMGFPEKEAKIYLVLLELKQALPSTISKKTGVERTNVYMLLERMMKKGLVSRVRKNRSYRYNVVTPHVILRKKKAEKEALSASIDQFEKVLPEVTALYQNYLVTPQMSVFEGREGIIQIMEDTLTSSTELCCWCNGDLALKSLHDYYPEYLKRKVELGLWLRGVFTYDQASLFDKRRGKQELREVYLIPKERYPFTNEINIYDDKVAIISHEDEIGVIIQNEHIANTQRAIFQLTFDYAKILELSLLTEEDKAYIAEGTQEDEGFSRPEA